MSHDIVHSMIHKALFIGMVIGTSLYEFWEEESAIRTGSDLVIKRFYRQ